jgi:hypothetical protein
VIVISSPKTAPRVRPDARTSHMTMRASADTAKFTIDAITRSMNNPSQQRFLLTDSWKCCQVVEKEIWELFFLRKKFEHKSEPKCSNSGDIMLNFAPGARVSYSLYWRRGLTPRGTVLPRGKRWRHGLRPGAFCPSHPSLNEVGWSWWSGARAQEGYHQPWSAFLGHSAPGTRRTQSDVCRYSLCPQYCSAQELRGGKTLLIGQHRYQITRSDQKRTSG